MNDALVKAAKNWYDYAPLWPYGTIARAEQDLERAELRYALEAAGVIVKVRR